MISKHNGIFCKYIQMEFNGCTIFSGSTTTSKLMLGKLHLDNYYMVNTLIQTSILGIFIWIVRRCVNRGKSHLFFRFLLISILGHIMFLI